MDVNKLPTTRAEAKATGAKHYYTGLPCKHGHIAARLTKGVCLECRRIDWETQNEKRKTLPKSEAAKAAGKRYYEKNKELVKARAAARPTEEKRKYRKKHKKENPELYKALTSVRKRRHKDATPVWVTDEQKKQMRALYLKAQEMTEITGERYVVDHIIPLRGKEVCGLHVPWNLKVVTQTENLIKSNKLLEN